MTEQEAILTESRGSTALVRADIVILASSHNPSIVSPDWLKRWCEVEEKPKQFIHTPEFSLFDSDSYLITVDPSRVQLVSKELDEGGLNRVAGIACRYVSSLPHVPYQAVGLNFVWLWRGDGSQRPQISVSVSSSPVPGVAKGYKMKCGAILYGMAEDHRMKMTVELPASDQMTFNVNFHLDVAREPTSSITDWIASFWDRMLVSRHLVAGLFLGGSNG